MKENNLNNPTPIKDTKEGRLARLRGFLERSSHPDVKKELQGQIDALQESLKADKK